MGKNKLRTITVQGQDFYWRYAEKYAIKREVSVAEWLHLRNTLPTEAQELHPLMQRRDCANLGRFFFCPKDNKKHKVIIWLKSKYLLRQSLFNPNLPSIASQMIQFFMEKHIDFTKQTTYEFTNGLELLSESDWAGKYRICDEIVV